MPRRKTKGFGGYLGGGISWLSKSSKKGKRRTRKGSQHSTRGNGGDGSNSIFPTNNGTQFRGISNQKSWVHGVQPAMPQVVNQINTLDQAEWPRREDGIAIFDLTGTLRATSRPTSYIEVRDFDFILDLSAELLLVKGSDTTVASVVNACLDFPALTLPVLNLDWIQPGVVFEVVQVVCARYGEVVSTGWDTILQPGMGVVGEFGADGPTLGAGGQFVIRYRFYRPWRLEPMIFAAVVNPSTSTNYTTMAPLVAFERKWKLQLPRQDAYDRQDLPIEFAPMPNAYTFSFVPQYPFSMAMEFDQGDPVTVNYSLMFDPNEDEDMVQPLAGIVAVQRREVLFSEEVLVSTVIWRWYFTQSCRVYVRVIDENLEDPRVRWSELRPRVTIRLPGYDETHSPPMALPVRAKHSRHSRRGTHMKPVLTGTVREEAPKPPRQSASRGVCHGSTRHCQHSRCTGNPNVLDIEDTTPVIVHYPVHSEDPGGKTD